MIFDAQFLYAIHQIFCILGRDGWQNTVPKIKNVPGPAAIAFKNPRGFLTYLFFGRKQNARIKITLNRLAARLGFRFGNVLCPVDSDDVTF